MSADYELQSMKDALKKCEANIKLFEEAIEREQATMREYKSIIRALEFKRDNPVPTEIKIELKRE